ncbi:hypothetical protein Rt10032_c02g0642 [Rhodotorula toruloides]|uniref:Uncharacterized protein n=1 Tax=Rhodotorula toruloides TaxID=5286 RepID=A0A511K9F8_RHOTO|nr:hypothetical protein Rt10032_c02g0642 [Rhodotorula toruloides]
MRPRPPTSSLVTATVLTRLDRRVRDFQSHPKTVASKANISMNPGGPRQHPTAKDSNLFMGPRSGAGRGTSGSASVTGAARQYPAPPRPLQHIPPPGFANGGSHGPVTHSPAIGAPSPQNEAANHAGPLANGIRFRVASGPAGSRLAGAPLRSASPLPHQADASDALRPRINKAVEDFCGVSNVLREQADEAAAFTFPDLAQDEAEELRNKFDEARRKKSLERQQTINRAYGNIAQTLQEVIESFVARALAPHVEVMRQTTAAVQDLTSRFDQLSTEVDDLKKTVTSQARPAPPTGLSAARLPPGLSAPPESSIDPARIDKLEKDIGECGLHLNAVKKQVGTDQEKLAKLPDIETRIGVLEKQASQTTDPRRRSGFAIGAVPAPPPPPGPSPVELQKAEELEKAVGDVKGRVDLLEARVGVVDELEKKVADVQLKVDEVAKDAEKKKDADDMGIDDESGEKLSVLEKRLEEVREEWVKEVAAVKEGVDKVSGRQTVPPEHVPLVASLAHFAAAGRPDLSSEELAKRLEIGLRGWDAGFGSHEERIKEMRSELSEFRQASEKKLVDVAELSEACAEQALTSFSSAASRADRASSRSNLPLASHIAAYLRRGQIRGRFPTPQEIGFPSTFRIDNPTTASNASNGSRQTSPDHSHLQQLAARVGDAASAQGTPPGRSAAGPPKSGGSNKFRPGGSS